MNEKIMKQEAQYDWLKDEVHCLYERNHDLKDRIDKAIEKISSLKEYVEYEEDTTFYTQFFDKIVDILKGSDKSE